MEQPRPNTDRVFTEKDQQFLANVKQTITDEFGEDARFLYREGTPLMTIEEALDRCAVHIVDGSFENIVALIRAMHVTGAGETDVQIRAKRARDALARRGLGA